MESIPGLIKCLKIWAQTACMEHSKQIFLEKELHGVCCRKICGPILGIYKSITDKIILRYEKGGDKLYLFSFFNSAVSINL